MFTKIRRIFKATVNGVVRLQYRFIVTKVNVKQIQYAMRVMKPNMISKCKSYVNWESKSKAAKAVLREIINILWKVFAGSILRSQLQLVQQLLAWMVNCGKARVKSFLKPRLDDTTCCQTGWQPGKCLYTRYNRLSNPLSYRLYNPVWQPVERTSVRSTRLSMRLSNPFDNRFHNRLYRVYKHSTSCQTVFVKPVVQPGLTTGWMNSCSFNTVVKPVWQPIWQPVGCMFTRYSRLSIRLPVVSCKRGISSKYISRYTSPPSWNLPFCGRHIYRNMPHTLYTTYLHRRRWTDRPTRPPDSRAQGLPNVCAGWLYDEGFEGHSPWNRRKMQILKISNPASKFSRNCLNFRFLTTVCKTVRTICYRTVVLWHWCIAANSCADQDETRHGGRPYCVTWGPSSPSPKEAQAPIFGPCALWPNGWMY